MPYPPGRNRKVPLWFILILWSAACAPLPPQQELVLGTLCSVNLYQGGTKRIYQEIFSRLRAIESMMSANSAGTEVDRINQNAGLQPVRVHQELLDALDAALGYAELSGGAFDPTVGPLVKLWGIGFPDARVPTEAEIRQALEKVGWRDLAVDRQKSTVFLRRSGMALDLGALAKGYAADAAAAIIRKNRLPGAIIDLGGNIFAYGEKPGKGPWRIGIRNPLDIPGPVLGVLTLKNKTVVSSGGYERYLEAGGMRYHHILSTRSGYPVETGLLSVTIIADRSIDGDGLSTAVFALGYARGAPLIESLPAVDAVFVFEDRRVIATSGCADYFNLTHPAYTAAASP